MNYTLSMFNTGQITLPKKWRTKFKTDKFVAQETSGGLLIKPLDIEDVPEGLRDENVEYIEDEKGMHIHFKKR